MLKPIRVSELLDYTNKILKTDFMLRRVGVKGEIAECSVSQAGHVYFTLKDDRARVACVMFREDVPEDPSMYKVGLEVEVQAQIDVYLPSGRLQMIVREIIETGEGALYKLFLQLKGLLQKEGLFDMDKKRPLPEYPLTVGMVTSTSGAAQHDFLSVAAERNPAIDVVISPSRVQGEGAGKELAAAFMRLDRRDDIDVIVLTRGGGSMEDLFCFNDETLIRTLAERRHPVVSAVGHEVDTTLCDYVADFRAATPTHGAEILIPDREKILKTGAKTLERAAFILTHRIAELAHLQREWHRRLVAAASGESVRKRRADLDVLKQRMQFLVDDALLKHRYELVHFKRTLTTHSMTRGGKRHRAELAVASRRMDQLLEFAAIRESERLKNQKARLFAAIGSKGRPIVFKGDEAIRRIEDISLGDRLSIYFADGKIEVQVKEVETYDHEL